SDMRSGRKSAAEVLSGMAGVPIDLRGQSRAGFDSILFFGLRQRLPDAVDLGSMGLLIGGGETIQSGRQHRASFRDIAGPAGSDEHFRQGQLPFESVRVLTVDLNGLAQVIRSLLFEIHA